MNQENKKRKKIKNKKKKISMKILIMNNKILSKMCKHPQNCYSKYKKKEKK